MKFLSLIRRTLILLAVALPAAAQQTVPIHDQMLGMNASYLSCPQGFHCEGTMIRNPLSLDSQVVFSAIRPDGRAGHVQPANLWTMWPNSRTAQASGAVVAPFAPAAEVLQKYIIPQRVLRMVPGAKLVGVQQMSPCPASRQGRTDCAMALLTYTSREGQAMDLMVQAHCDYQQNGVSQFNDVLFFLDFAPHGQLQTAATPLVQQRVDPNWHAREQQRAQQMSAQIARNFDRTNGQIISTGQAQVDAVHQWGRTVLAQERSTQHAIDDVAQDEADTVGDRFTDHTWRNSRGEITHTDSNQSPGPGWVQIRQ